MLRYLASALVFAGMSALPAVSQNSNNSDKPLDVQSSVGDLHVGKDADAHAAGLPVYPGAHPKREQDSEPLNLAIQMESFGLKVVIAKYESGDPAEKILAFYKDKMKKYGQVLECHHSGDHSGSHLDDNDNDRNRPLKCDGDDSGPVRELKVGTEGNAHVVDVEPSDSGKGTFFSIVYVRSRGKTGDI